MNDIDSILKHIENSSGSAEQKQFSTARLFNCFNWILEEKKSQLSELMHHTNEIQQYFQKLGNDLKSKDIELNKTSDYATKLQTELNHAKNVISNSSEYVSKLEKELLSAKNELSQVHKNRKKYYMSRL